MDTKYEANYEESGVMTYLDDHVLCSKHLFYIVVILITKSLQSFVNDPLTNHL